MKQILSKWFGAARDNESALPAPEQNNEPSQKEHPKLREAFKDAVYGNRFRTLSYISGFDDPATADKEWLEAFKMPGQGWKIKSMLSHDGAATGEPVVNQKVLDGTYSFWTAVEKLAVYEATQGSLNKEPCESQGAEELGYLYLRTFAEREGIAFDVAGRPHPTSQGMIVSNGSFPPEAYDKAEGAYKHAKEIHTVPIKDLAKALLPDVQTDDIGNLNYAKKIANAADQIFQCTEAVLGVLKTMPVHYDEEVDYVLFFGRTFKDKSKPRRKYLEGCHNSFYNDARVLFGKTETLLSGDPEVDSFKATPLYLFNFFAATYVAGYTEHCLQKGKDITNCTPKEINFLVNKASENLEQAGIKKDDSRLIVDRHFKSCARYWDSGNPEKGYGPMTSIVHYLKDTRDFYEGKLGVDGVTEVQERPSQEKLVQQLKM